MIRLLLGRCLVLVPLALSLGSPPAAHADKSPARRPIQIGMAQTMVVDVPQPFVDLLGYPFSALTKEFTGLNGELKIGGSPFDVARNLEQGKVQLAVFQGVEFAWVRARHPGLKPLMVAIYQNKHLHVQLVTRKDAGIDEFTDLRNKDVAYPRKSKEHCRVFMERFCNECGECAPRAFFNTLCQPSSVEQALDQLAQGKCDAVIADKTDVDFYRRIKPGVFRQFRIVKNSEPFPPGVIAYAEGQIDARTLDQFRNGMIRANRSERGRDMMGMWRITSFEEVPASYQQNLEEIVRAYPAP